jgi:hypothetical protein
VVVAIQATHPLGCEFVEPVAQPIADPGAVQFLGREQRPAQARDADNLQRADREERIDQQQLHVGRSATVEREKVQRALGGGVERLRSVKHGWVTVRHRIALGNEPLVLLLR